MKTFMTIGALAVLMSTIPCTAQGPAYVDGILLPPLDMGAGCFYTPATYPNETLYFAAMRDAGCNTLAPQSRPLAGQPDRTAAEDIARELNNAASVGLMNPKIPVICYSVGPQDLLDAKKYKDPAVEWPELVIQSIDEPSYTQIKWLEQYRDDAHAAGLRIGTACAGYNITGYITELPWYEPEHVGEHVPGYADMLDIWIILVGTFRDDVYTLAEKQGATIGVYIAYPSNPMLDRFTFGLYSWKMKSKITLAWAAVNKQKDWDYSRIKERDDGAFDPKGLSGIAAGIIDHRVLQAVRDLHSPEGDVWLREVAEQIDAGWWPRSYVKDDQWLEIPEISMDRIRKEGLAILKASPDSLKKGE
jgi:hypothetical protein